MRLETAMLVGSELQTTGGVARTSPPNALAGFGVGPTFLRSHRQRALRDLLPAHDVVAFDQGIARLSAAGARVRCLGWVGGRPLQALVWGALQPSVRVLLTAGVHGVEPAGPAAIIWFVEEALRQPWRYEGVEVTAIPLINPVGYHRRIRGNADGIDLNRAFSERQAVPHEVKLCRAILRVGRYDLAIDLHSSRSAGRRGYFALHRDALDLLGPAMMRFARHYPVLDQSTDRYALDAKGILRSRNRGTIKDYLADRGVRWAVTIEAPAAIPYAAQVRGTVEIVQTLMETALSLRRVPSSSRGDGDNRPSSHDGVDSAGGATLTPS